MKANDLPIVVEATYNTSKLKVWQAITQLNKMKVWYFKQIPSFKPEVGFKTEFNVATPECDFLHQWEITEVIPEQKIAYTWQYKSLDGLSLVTFQLSESDNKTTLKLTNTVLKDYVSGYKNFERESCVEGWNYFIKQQLANYLS